LHPLFTGASLIICACAGRLCLKQPAPGAPLRTRRRPTLYPTAAPSPECVACQDFTTFWIASPFCAASRAPVQALFIGRQLLFTASDLVHPHFQSGHYGGRLSDKACSPRAGSRRPHLFKANNARCSCSQKIFALRTRLHDAHLICGIASGKFERLLCRTGEPRFEIGRV
jgi:hypothetical protein